MVSVNVGPWGGEYPDDEAALNAFSTLLFEIVEGREGANADAEYRRLRQMLLSNPEYADVIPPVVRSARSAAQFSATMAKLETKDGDPAEDLLPMLEPLLARADELTERTTHVLHAPNVSTGSPELGRPALQVHDAVSRTTADAVDIRPGSRSAPGPGSSVGEVTEASRWTGVVSRAARLKEVRSQIDVAYVAVGYLIDDLAEDDGNGGPLLDEHSDALEALRELHRTLGQLLAAIDSGRLDDEMGEGFAADVARLIGNWISTLREQPARYVIATTVFATLSACGLGDLGGFLSSAAVSIPKRTPRDAAE